MSPNAPDAIVEELAAPAAPVVVAESKAAPAYSLETDMVLVGSTDQYHASSVPIYQTATFKQERGEFGPYDYSRSGNPTRTALEEHLAKIMGASRAYAVASGMSALDVIARLLRPGQEVVAGNDLYGGSDRLLTYMKNNSGVVVHNVDTTSVEAVRAVVSGKTGIVLLESPTNPLIKVVDVRAITKAVHELNSDAIVVVDNTMLSPMGCRPLEFGVDVVYESATKFLNGHHDSMGGVIAVKDAELAKRIFFVINATGCAMTPFDSFLLLRGIKTLALRYERQEANSYKVAEWLEGRGFKVRYPGLKSHPQYDLHWSMARGAGAVLTIETGSIPVSEKIVANTRIWGIAVSFGCVNSLISMPCKMSHASIDPKVRAERALPEDLIRLCVGIEGADDLIADLETALRIAGALNTDGTAAVAPQ
ncbi:cystathionine beta-lyase-like protein [Dipodascopsis tothii]|uniref:cystathionine beta-lyase-like protein n=1 Tax=Dipodascopsis tothii TaxID=44089 RepID=UPI0034CD711E